MLQCRSGKLTGKGAVRIAVDMVSEKLIDTRTTIMRVEPQHLDQLLHPQVLASSVFSILLRDLYNFKARIQVAAALAVPPSILDYGKSYSDVVQGVEPREKWQHFLSFS
ncbi:pyruvate, phosphate dikinase, chloroplastic [Tanacetum coccineum]